MGFFGGLVRIVWGGVLPVIGLLALGAVPVFLWSEGYIDMWSGTDDFAAFTDRAITRELRMASPDGRSELVLFGFEGDTDGTLSIVAAGTPLDPESYWAGPSFFWPEAAEDWMDLPVRIAWAADDHIVVRYCGFPFIGRNEFENTFRPTDLSIVREEGCSSAVGGPSAVSELVPVDGP